MSQQQPVNWKSLLKAAQGGNQNCQNELIKALSVRLRLSIKYRCCGWSPEDQEDILQETLEVFWNKLDSISDHPERYALKILINKIGNEIQKRKGKQCVLPETVGDHCTTFIDEPFDVLTKIEQQEYKNRFIFAIKRLSPYCRTLFMGLLEGKSINEMWEIFSSLDLGLTRSAFDTRNTRCRYKLYRELKRLPKKKGGN